MMKFIFRPLISLALAFIVVVALAFYLVVDFSETELPATILEPEEERQYYYTLRRLINSGRGDERGFALSPRELSYFCEMYLPGKRYRGFRVNAVRIRGVADDIEIKLVLRGPLGFYYRVQGSGQLNYDGEKWQVNPSGLYLGKIPFSWFLPSTINPDWPASLPSHDLRLKSADVDAAGLALRLSWGEGSELSILEMF